MYKNLLHDAHQISDAMIAWRRHIHQCPELKMNTPETERYHRYPQRHRRTRCGSRDSRNNARKVPRHPCGL